MKLDDFHYHEALDRSYIIENIIEELLINHAVFKKHKKLRKKVVKAQTLLTEVYQEVGSLSILKSELKRNEITQDQDLSGDYDVHIPFVTKNGKRYRMYEIPPIHLCLTERQKELLNKIYGIVWMDAYYDPDESKSIREYAKELADMMKELNETLHFKL